MTALERIITGMIESDGPMPLDRYMALCLGHPEHGYYMTRDPFGRAGDFTTAPEISQVFGELIGVWCMNVWHLLQKPRHFALVELGPGRGTLMADVLRVLRKDEACRKAAEVHFVETSPVLREAQRRLVPDATWHSGIASLPARPTILIANEFFDALPIQQFERREGRVFERCVGVTEGRLSIGLVPSAMPLALHGDGVVEDSSIRDALAAALGNHLNTVGGAGLIIDYGHAKSATGDTLQAMKSHKFVSITEAPGEADITSHVDFQSLSRAFAKEGATVSELMTQGDFLTAMGINERTEALLRTLEGEKRQSLMAATERLAHPGQMGHLFKVTAVTGAGLAPPYPFGAA
ncbi:MAG: SAM-dependent methyltransferase [Proteobacteria bacterium]|nr:SAM-dependent methyltransferase [Pseudomonadota bacterium]